MEGERPPPDRDDDEGERRRDAGKRAAGEPDADEQALQARGGRGRAAHEVFGDPVAGAVAFLVLVMQAIAYSYRDPCTC